jgi:hypothetical protein
LALCVAARASYFCALIRARSSDSDILGITESMTKRCPWPR